MPRLPLSENDLSSTRSRILAEAAKIVGQSGLSGLSMRNLARHLRLTPGAIYRYFPSKQELLWALWEGAIVELRSSFDEIDSSALDPAQAVRGMLKVYANFCLADPDRFRLLFLEKDPGLTHVTQRDQTALAPYDALRTRVAEILSARNIADRDAERTTQMLWACAHGVVTLAITINEVDFGNVGQLVDDTIDTIMRGLLGQE